MNDKKRQKKTNNATKLLPATQCPSIEKQIRDHAEEFAPDMNLRLFCEMLLPDVDSMLWVESICVTDITYPQKAPETEAGTAVTAGFLRRLFHRTSALKKENTKQKDGQKPTAGTGLLGRWLGHDKR